MKIFLVTPPGGRLTSWADRIRDTGSDPIVAHSMVEVLEGLEARGGPPSGVVIDGVHGDRAARMAHIIRAFRGETAVFISRDASNSDGCGEWRLPAEVDAKPAALPAFLRSVSVPAIAANGCSRFIEINGHRLHYIDWSPTGGTPVLVLPGKTGIAADASEACNLLHPYFRVLSVDYRGYGYSQWSAEPYTANAIVSDTVELVRALDLRDITILATCFGTVVAAGLAHAVPERLSRVVFAQLRPQHFGRPVTHLTEAYIDWVVPRELLSEEEARTFLQKLAVPPVTNPVWHETRFRHAFRHTVEGLRYRLDPKIFHRSVRNYDEFYDCPFTHTIFERLDCPFLCVEYDGLLDEESRAYLASRPNVTVARSTSKALENFEPTFVAALARFLEID